MTDVVTRFRARLRRGAVRLGFGGGPSAFARVAYLIPRQVVIVTAVDAPMEALWPVDWHMPVSLEPARYAFACDAAGFGAGVVLSSGYFVVNFVSAALEKEIIAAGSMSGRDGNKRERLGLGGEKCLFVPGLRLALADGWLECQVEEARRWGDRLLVVGRVRHAEPPAPKAALFHEWRP